MFLLAPGPVPIEKEYADIAAIQQLPYFRGADFAQIMIEVTEGLRHVFQTRSTPLTITASGTGLMEMAIANLLNPQDKVVVINGGTFGQKWVNMCKAFNISVKEFKVQLGKTPDLDILDGYLTSDIKALLVNAHETSTGYLYDTQKLGYMTNAKNILFIVDAVSSIGADEFRMDDWHVDCAMVSTQKALGLMPGLGFIAFSPRAEQVIPTVKQPRFYFDALDYLKNIPRGMTPFTPAMIAILQMRQKLKQIRDEGIDHLVAKHTHLAQIFRETIWAYDGFKVFPERPSNALTAITLPENATMSKIITRMREDYDWWFAPNPTNRETYLRVSHMGDISEEQMKQVAHKIALVTENCMKGNGE